MDFHKTVKKCRIMLFLCIFKATEVIEINIRSQTIIALISLKVCGHLLASPGEGRRS